MSWREPNATVLFFLTKTPRHTDVLRANIRVRRHGACTSANPRRRRPRCQVTRLRTQTTLLSLVPTRTHPSREFNPQTFLKVRLDGCTNFKSLCCGSASLLPSSLPSLHPDPAAATRSHTVCNEIHSHDRAGDAPRRTTRLRSAGGRTSLSVMSSSRKWFRRWLKSRHPTSQCSPRRPITST